MTKFNIYIYILQKLKIIKKTALHYAAANNNKETVELLILDDANINEKVENVETAL